MAQTTELTTSTLAGTATETQGSNHKNTVVGATLATGSARVLIQQEEISDIKEIPNLPIHQRAAKQQSHTWLNDIWPLIIRSTADIIDYANTFQAVYAELLTLVPKLEKGDTSARDELVQSLEQGLAPALQEKASSSKNSSDKIKAFHGNFQPLYRSFHTDFTKANDLLTKDQKEIREKQSEKDDADSKAAKYIHAAIGLFFGADVTGLITVAVGATGIGLAIGAFLMLAELAAMATLIKYYVDEFKRSIRLGEEIAALKKQVAQLSTVKHQVNSLHSNTQEVVTSHASVAAGWNTLQTELADTVKDLKSSSPEQAATVLNGKLSTANTEWGVVLKQAKRMQPDGGQIPVRMFETTADMLKAMQQGA